MNADRDPGARTVDAADPGGRHAVDVRCARLDRWAEIQALAESLARREPALGTEAVDRD